MSINGKQSVKLEKRIMKFENYFKQIPIPVMKVLTKKKIKITFLVVLLIKLFVLMIGLLSQLLFIEVKMQLMNLLKQFLRSISTAEK